MFEQLCEINLIQTADEKKDRVMDLACGKGGDLGKFKKAEIGYYCGIDIALESVRRRHPEIQQRRPYIFSDVYWPRRVRPRLGRRSGRKRERSI